MPESNMPMGSERAVVGVSGGIGHGAWRVVVTAVAPRLSGSVRGSIPHRRSRGPSPSRRSAGVPDCQAAGPTSADTDAKRPRRAGAGRGAARATRGRATWATATSSGSSSPTAPTRHVVFEQRPEPSGAGPASSGPAAARRAARPAPRDGPHLPALRLPLVHPTDWQRDRGRLLAHHAALPELRDACARSCSTAKRSSSSTARSTKAPSASRARPTSSCRRHFEEETAKFVAALEADLILPIDF